MARRVRRLSLAVALGLTLATMTVSVALAGKPTPPPPTPPYGTLAIDKSCNLTAVGAWTSPFGFADIQVFRDGAWIYTLDSEHGPYPGSIDASGSVVTWSAIPIGAGRNRHSYTAQITFYSSYLGINYGNVITNAVTARCV